MRGRLIARPTIIAFGLLVASCGGGSDGAGVPSGSSPAGLPAKTASAGRVVVKVVPVRLDAGGAVFDVSFDTHAVELDTKLPAGARLVVGGRPWKATKWVGDGPGGHHRQGKISFRAGGPPTGSIVLTIGGLPKPARFEWN